MFTLVRLIAEREGYLSSRTLPEFRYSALLNQRTDKVMTVGLAYGINCSRMMDSYSCRICGQIHSGVPLSWGPDAPDMWAELPIDEQAARGELGTDQAVIDASHFFIRGRLEIPVTDTSDLFAWLVWVEVSEDSFDNMSQLWTVAGREKTPPYDGQLSNRLALYSEPTLGLKVKLHTRPVGERPFVEVVGDHQLRYEQGNGISAHRVQEIANLLNRD